MHLEWHYYFWFGKYGCLRGPKSTAKTSFTTYVVIGIPLKIKVMTNSPLGLPIRTTPSSVLVVIHSYSIVFHFIFLLIIYLWSVDFDQPQNNWMLAQKTCCIEIEVEFFLTAVIIIIVIKLHFVRFFSVSENRRAKRTTKKCWLLTESRSLVALEPKGRIVVQIFDLGQNTRAKNCENIKHFIFMIKCKLQLSLIQKEWMVTW